MLFDVNQTEFPTQRHKAIWNEGRQVVPLEVSLADITDPEMREGCTQIYNWTREYFEKIYEDPNQFSGYTPHGMFRLLDVAAKKTDVADGGLVINSRKYKQIVSVVKKYLKDSLSDLSLVGLEIIDCPGYKLLINKKYPLFCKYFKLFSDGSYRKPINSLSYILYNDFRVFAPKYNRTLDDLLRVIPDRIKPYAAEMDAYALAKGAVIEQHKTYAQYRYKYKNRYILVMQNTYNDTILDIAVPYRGAGDGYFGGFGKWVEIQPDKDEIAAFIQKEICTCYRGCGGSGSEDNPMGCDKAGTDIFGVNRHITQCVRSVSRLVPMENCAEYNDYDIKMLKRLIDIRMIQLENEPPYKKDYFPTTFVNIQGE